MLVLNLRSGLLLRPAELVRRRVRENYMFVFRDERKLWRRRGTRGWVSCYSSRKKPRSVCQDCSVFLCTLKNSVMFNLLVCHNLYGNKADDYPSDDSGDTAGSEGMDNDDSLTNDDLIKFANHVQKLLQQIKSLQSLVPDNTKTSHHSKHHILKAYCRFCQQFESSCSRN